MMKKFLSEFFSTFKAYWKDCGSYLIHWFFWLLLMIIAHTFACTEPFVSILGAGYTDQVGAGMAVAFLVCTFFGALISGWMLLDICIRKSSAHRCDE